MSAAYGLYLCTVATLFCGLIVALFWWGVQPPKPVKIDKDK